jgi:hypothetical protein
LIVKREDGYYVVSEKTEKNLGGPYKTKAEAEKDFNKWNSSNTKKQLSLLWAGKNKSQQPTSTI